MTTEIVFDEKQSAELLRLLGVDSLDAVDAETILGKLRTAKAPVLAASHGGAPPNAVQRDVARRRKLAGMDG